MLSASQGVVLLVLFWASIAVQVFAFLDALFRPASGFLAENKLKKPIWLLILGAALAVAYAAPSFGSVFLSLILVTPALVYLADVRPKLQTYSRGRGRGRRPGPGRPSSGGW